jgi:toxin-antitoxin system, antitoxin component, hicB family
LRILEFDRNNKKHYFHLAQPIKSTGAFAHVLFCIIKKQIKKGEIMIVTYPAIFYEEKEGEGYSVFLPDFNNSATCGEDLNDAIYMTQDLITTLILDCIENKTQIPKASKIKDIKYDEEFEKELDDWEYESRFKSYITVDTTLLEKRWDKRRVTRKVKILKQYARRAEEEGIDLSNILEMALFDKFELYSDNDKKNELSINSNDNVIE